MRLTFHRLIFWAHLICGIIAGIVILSMAVSGLIIAFETQLMDWANRDLRVSAPANAIHLDVEALITKVRESKSDLQPSAITWKSDRTLPATLSVGREATYFVNPYTGAFLGEGNHTWHDFFRAVTAWHRFLTGTGLERETGKAITGAGTLVFGTLLVSGIYLWWPRRWRWTNLRAVLLLNRKLSGRARDWNWHNVVGFWSSFPMLLIILTGLIISYSWANNLLFRVTGNDPPPPRTAKGPTPGGPGGPSSPKEDNQKGRGPRGEKDSRSGGEPRSEGGGPQDSHLQSNLTGLPSLLEQTRTQAPNWVSLTLRMPSTPGDPFPVTVDRGGRGQVHLRSTLTLNTTQQSISTSPDDFSKQNLGRQLRMYSRYLHTGELFGFWGQVIAALCALSAVLLVWTGFALTWRRFFKRRGKATASPS